MKTSNTKMLAVGFLVLIGATTAAPLSQAETVGTKRVSTAFAYDPAAPAEKIYSDLQATAHKTCKHGSSPLLVLRKYEKQCAAEMVDSGVAQFGRADVGQLHKGRITVANR